ncbi:MAG: YggT family protein [Betaproteobacteria bacterium]|nr:YggT family protein [Betaproteobacteria bacterium]MCL2886693.1 YggT family protein [Betaproteobacteria bacterium]
MQALFFLINAVVSFFSILFLLRFLMQLARVSFAGQIGDFVVRLTNWAVKPLRRVIPGLAGIDWACLLAALATQALLAGLILAISGLPPGGEASLIILKFAVFGLLRLTVYILIGAVILQALLSWINPYSPLAPLLHQLTRPLLDPIRRVVPSISGIDLSPLVAILLLQVVLIYL